MATTKTTTEQISDDWTKIESSDSSLNLNYDFYYCRNVDDPNCLRYDVCATKKHQREIVAFSWGNLKVHRGLKEVIEDILK